MDSAEWDSVLHFSSTDSLDFDFFDAPDKHAADDDHMAESYPSPQVPTPPPSSRGSPPEGSDGNTLVSDGNLGSDGNTLVSVSTTFFPGANNINDPSPPDLVLVSSDSVFFYVHTHVLLRASSNGFNALLPVPPSQHADAILALPESSAVLNIVLHTVHDMPCAQFSPSFDTVCTAVSSLQTYGVPLHTYIAPSTPLYKLILSFAPLHPLDTYALAASHDLHALAVPASSHLLAFNLASLPDDAATRMGPVYLKRLFFFHFGRTDALKRLLLPPPHPHAPLPGCDFAEQKKVTRAWALASAYLAWDARPDLSTSAIESALKPLGERLTCDACRAALNERIRNLVVQWSLIKRTI
ncbi:hypothetical protein PLICRDRAFT_33626 [Plicaturopsis crispa FD-325 SS-3]|nr:hypothetical protein PLICRDRAFT_33626 [Plicaturopsis crispa FD-325 SS-3]